MQMPWKLGWGRDVVCLPPHPPSRTVKPLREEASTAASCPGATSQSDLEWLQRAAQPFVVVRGCWGVAPAGGGTPLEVCPRR